MWRHASDWGGRGAPRSGTLWAEPRAWGQVVACLEARKARALTLHGGVGGHATARMHVVRLVSCHGLGLGLACGGCLGGQEALAVTFVWVGEAHHSIREARHTLRALDGAAAPRSRSSRLRDRAGSTP